MKQTSEYLDRCENVLVPSAQLEASQAVVLGSALLIAAL